jgi:hypothetical protein
MASNLDGNVCGRSNPIETELMPAWIPLSRKAR